MSSTGEISLPGCGHLANGIPLEELGTPVNDPVRLPLPVATRTATGWLGQVIHIDHFGNISSNLRREHLGERDDVTVRLYGG